MLRWHRRLPETFGKPRDLCDWITMAVPLGVKVWLIKIRRVKIRTRFLQSKTSTHRPACLSLVCGIDVEQEACLHYLVRHYRDDFFSSAWVNGERERWRERAGVEKKDKQSKRERDGGGGERRLSFSHCIITVLMNKTTSNIWSAPTALQINSQAKSSLSETIWRKKNKTRTHLSHLSVNKTFLRKDKMHK